MNTIMAEKINAALKEWNPSKMEPIEVSTEEQEQGQAQEQELHKLYRLTEHLRDIIRRHPGITGIDIRKVAAQENPNLCESSVPATLAQLYQMGVVSRRNFHNTFEYFSVEGEPYRKPKTPVKRGPVKKPKPKKAAPVPPTQPPGIHSLLPAQPPVVAPTPTPAPVQKRTTASILLTIRVGDSLFDVTPQEAHTLYEQLHVMFAR
jgi:hypothetical protein